MGRSPEIDAILEAWFKLEYCVPTKRAQAQVALRELLEKAAKKGGDEVTPFQIQTALYERYKAFKAEKFKSDPTQIAKSALKPGS